MNPHSDYKYQAPALDKGLDILEFLSSQNETVTQADIAKGIDKNPNEIYRMLMCLEERGYIIRDSMTGLYQLSLKLFNLSHSHSPLEKLISVAKPLMRKLSAVTNQASHLTVFYENQLMIVAPTLSPGPISIAMEEGRVYPLLSTTSGRVLLAQCDKTEQTDRLNHLDDFTSLPSKQKTEILESIAMIHSSRSIIRKSMITQGITDISTMIGDESSTLKAALSLCCIDSLLNKTMSKKTLCDATVATAKEIASILGYE